MKDKKRVAIIDNSVDVTGALKAILHYCEFAKSRYHFLFILPSGSRASIHLQEEGYEVIGLPFLEISKNWKHLVNYLPRLYANARCLRKILSDKEIDLVHVNDFYNLTAIMVKVMGTKFPLITHIRFMPDIFPAPLVKIWVGLNLRFASKIVCVSKAVQNCLPKHQKIQVIYDRLEDFSLENIQIINVPERDTIDLLYLGHYIQGKGQDLALEAFYKAFRKNPKLRLRFVGGDMGLRKNQMFKEQLRKRARDLGLSEVVKFDGPSHKVQEEILATDIVLNFSESESFSMTCLETLMLEKPLIASDCGGPAELFVHGESGWLVPNRDINAMSSAILQMSEDRKLREKISQKSVKYVKEKFAVANTSAVLVDQYTAIFT